MIPQIIDNPGGGNCAFYAFAIGLIDAIQKQLVVSATSATLNLLRQKIQEFTSKDNDLSISEKTRYASFIDNLELNVRQYKFEQAQPEFLAELQHALRYVAYKQRLLEINRTYKDSLGLTININPKSRPLRLDLTNTFDAAYDELFYPILQIVAERLEQKDLALALIYFNQEKETCYEDNQDIIFHLLKAICLDSAAFQSLYKLIEYFFKQTPSLDLKAFLAIIEKLNKCEDISLDEMAKALLIFENIFRVLQSNAKFYLSCKKVQLESKLFFKRTLCELDIEGDEYLADIYRIFNAITNGKPAPTEALIAVSARRISPDNVSKEIAKKCNDLAAAIRKYENLSHNKLLDHEKKRYLRYYFFEQPCSKAVTVNALSSEARLPAKFNKESYAAAYYKTLLIDKTWGRDTDLLAIAAAFDGQLEVKIFRDSDKKQDPDSKQDLVKEQVYDPSAVSFLNLSKGHWVTLFFPYSDKILFSAFMSCFDGLVAIDKTIDASNFEDTRDSLSSCKAKLETIRTEVDSLQQTSIASLSKSLKNDFMINDVVLKCWQLIQTNLEESSTLHAFKSSFSQLNRTKDDGTFYPLSIDQYKAIKLLNEQGSTIQTAIKEKFALNKPPSIWIKFFAFLGIASAKKTLHRYHQLEQQKRQYQNYAATLAEYAPQCDFLISLDLKYEQISQRLTVKLAEIELQSQTITKKEHLSMSSNGSSCIGSSHSMFRKNPAQILEKSSPDTQTSRSVFHLRKTI